MTLARLATELGQRTAATDLLRSTIQALTQPHFVPPDEPCLAPSRRFEPVPTRPSAEALRIAVLETSGKRIQRVHAGPREISRVAGHHGKIVLQAGGRQKPIGDR